MTAPEIIALANPVEINGDVISSVSIRMPTDEDFAAVYRTNARAAVKAMKIVSCATNLDWRALAVIEAANDGLLASIDAKLTNWKG